MNESSCNIFCFKDCGDKYETLVMKKDIQTVEKLSLKKITQNKQTSNCKDSLQRVRSVSKLQHFKCSTDRSNEEMALEGQLSLIKKKIQIQQEIQVVNQSINVLSDRYRSKIKALQNIQKQMNHLLQSGKK